MTIQKAKQSTQEQFRNELVRVGFELETQRIGGKTWRDLDNATREVKKTRTIQKTDVSEYRAQIDGALSRTNSDLQKKIGLKIRKAFREDRTLGDLFVTVFDNYAQRSTTVTLNSKINEYSRSNPFHWSGTSPDRLIAELIAQANDSQKRTLIQIAQSIVKYRLSSPLPKLRSEEIIEEYTEEESIPLAEALADIGIPSDLTSLLLFKPDGSVQGPEITTIGPQTYSDAVSAAQKLFTSLSEISFDVNNGCSFHIHASIVDARPKYSRSFQSYLMRAVLNDPRVPSSVRDRWSSGSLDQYFNFTLDDQKYRFVAFRGNTWEFRCFGNISNFTDALACLNIVSDVYHSAITASSTDIMLPISMTFSDVAKYAARNRITFDAAIDLLSQRNSEAA